MRKNMLSLLLCGSLFCAVPYKLEASFLDNPHTVRQVAFVAVSLVVASGGTYLVSKRSKGFLNKVCSILGGCTMITGGILGVTFSKALLDTIDEQIKKTG